MTVPLHIEHAVVVKVSEDKLGLRGIISREDVDTEKVSFDQYPEALANAMVLVASATDIAVPIGSIASVQLIYIKAEGPISIRLNAGSAITIRPNPTVDAEARFFLETSGVTAITASNPDTVDSVRFTYLVAGE